MCVCVHVCVFVAVFVLKTTPHLTLTSDSVLLCGYTERVWPGHSSLLPQGRQHGESTELSKASGKSSGKVPTTTHH